MLAPVVVSDRVTVGPVVNVPGNGLNAGVAADGAPDAMRSSAITKTPLVFGRVKLFTVLVPSRANV